MLTSERMEVDKKEDEQGAPEASEQPSGELAVDGGKTDSETVDEPKQDEDKPDSEVTEEVPVEGKAAPTEDQGGSEEKESTMAGDTEKDSDEGNKQLPAVIELSSKIGPDPVTETQVEVENLTDSESKTDHDKDELEDEKKENDKEADEQEQNGINGTAVDSQDEQGLDTGRVRTLMDESETAVDEGCTTSNAGEGPDNSDMAESAGGRHDGGLAGEGLDNGEGALSGKSMEGIVGASIGLEPLEDIIEEDEEVEQREDPIDREQLLAGTKEVLLEQERLKSIYAQLQHKIAEYLAKKKSEERPDPSRNVTDQEKRYNQCMAALDVLETDLSTLQQRSELQYAHLQVLRDQKLAEVKQSTDNFAKYMKDTAITAVHSRTGRRLYAQEVEQFQTAEDKKEIELIQVRLENIKLQNKIGKLEAQIKEKEQLAEGLHMIDFEQLKINNVDLNEKIEERNEDILKLKKKVTSTVQVLTHVKEKLQFLQTENGEKRTALRNIDEVVAKKRDHLTRTKQARDALRMDNLRLKQKGGLVGHPALLGDFEERQDQNEELKTHLEKLQQRHSELTVICDGLRKKVEQARTIHPRNI